ncbi:hypothetical protein HELRODRAFT_169164 [Helobdella robusta]|uniref:Uncharacterized protein n=1 Tax=Helobdella robusta TaxID=6412 RepID=T1F1I3_HELRO|nr:hypothetical protein HELRODRAFT_169164 [Helobdella robusta]ESO08351.1 hypothetical protein HELRODRAFT_169164 [Helobdella robusta]
MSSQGSSLDLSSLKCCHACFKHFKLRHDGTFVRHGGKVKRTECSGSLKKPLSSLNRRRSFGSGMSCRKFGKTLTCILKAILDNSSVTALWCRLLFLHVWSSERGQEGIKATTLASE